jgi:hypothetical protein
MTNAFTNYGKGQFLNGNIDLVNDTIKVMLITDSHTPDVDAEEFIDDVSANEVAASGTYSAGGAALGTKSVTVDDTNNRAYFDAADIAFTSATITARWAYLYKDTGTPATSPIIGYYDYGANISSSAGTFTHSFTAPASGGALYLA